MHRKTMALPYPDNDHEGTALGEALTRFVAMHPKRIDLTLGRIERLLTALDHPEQRLGPVIHVAGTNGKGSVIAFLEALFRAHGLRVNRYTSPHLVRFAERIVLDGREISAQELLGLIDQAERANDGAPITFFEMTTAIAFLAFAARPADVTLLEVGLGGRLDATNCVPVPLAAVITPVGLDHEAFLGPDIATIAGEKAGILKPGGRAVIGPQTEQAHAVLTARAGALGMEVAESARDWRVSRLSAGQWRFEGFGADWTLPGPGLPGRHQIANAGTALAALFTAAPELNCTPDRDKVASAIKAASWPARLQALHREPGWLTLAAVLGIPEDWELWLDGAHNPPAAQELATFLGELESAQPLPLDLLTGIMGNKDAPSVLGPLLPLVRRLRMVPIPGTQAGADPKELAGEAQNLAADGCADIAPSPGWIAALADLARSTDPGPRRVVIAGSLYLAGAVLGDIEALGAGTPAGSGQEPRIIGM